MCPNVPRTTATPLGKPAVVSSLIAGDGNRCRRRFHSLRSSSPSEGRFSVQMHVHYQRNCPSEVAQCRLFTSPSSSMSPTLLAVNPPTMERTSQYCGGQGAAPRCLPLGRPSCTLRCSFPTREWGENSDASCRPTCHRIDGQTTCHFLPTAVHRPIVHHHQTKSKADARYGSARR